MEKKYLGYQGLQDVAGHVNTRLKTVTTIPASADDGAVRLYVGETGVIYKKGHIYQYNATDLEWVDITSSSEYTAGNGIDITDNEISVETYIFTGTQAQWDALTTDEKKEYQICNITDDGSTDNVYTVSEVNALLDEKLSYADNGILGAKNLLNNTATSQTLQNIAYVVNSDKTVSIAGGQTIINKFSNLVLMPNTVLKAGTYILSGCPVGGSANTYRLRLVKGSDLVGIDIGEGHTFTANGVDEYSITIGIGANNVSYTIPNDGLKFYPMLRLTSDPDNTYQPYAMTNKELTESNRKLTELKTYVSPNIGARFYKIGRVCYVSFESAVSDKAYVDEDIMDTIPEEFRPIYSASFLDTLGTSHNRIIIYDTIRAKGSFAAGQNIRGCLTYITNN